MNPCIAAAVKDITAAFQEKDKRGLAIVVANQTVPWKDYSDLGKGLPKVAKEMCETFKYLKFAVVYLEGKGSEVVKAYINVAAQSKHPDTFKRFVFYFTGHGKKEGSEYIMGTDQQGVKINEDLLLKFQPVNAQQIVSMPKLFFFDCCHGSFRDNGVIQGMGEGDANTNTQESMEEFVRITIRPSLGNSLLACAVMSNFQALADTEKGPIWGQKLQKLLRKNQSIYDILHEVNEEVMSVYDDWWQDPEKRKKAFGVDDGNVAKYRIYAQPAFTSTLHGRIINLFQEAHGAGGGGACGGVSGARGAHAGALVGGARGGVGGARGGVGGAVGSARGGVGGARGGVGGACSGVGGAHGSGGTRVPAVGPKRLTLDDLFDVYGEVYEIRTQWQNLGVLLNVDLPSLRAIGVQCREEPDNCLREVLCHWLKKVDPLPTWKAIVDALRNPVMNKPVLAGCLEAKYCSETRRLTLDDLFDVYGDVYDIRLRWRELGGMLKVDKLRLDAIGEQYRDRPDHCLQEVIVHWLKQVKPLPTWKVIVDMLRKPVMGESALAEKIRASRCPESLD